MPAKYYDRKKKPRGMRPTSFDDKLLSLGFVVDESFPLGKFQRFVRRDVSVTTMSGKKAILRGPKDKVKNGEITWDWDTILQKVRELPAPVVVPSDDEATMRDDEE